MKRFKTTLLITALLTIFSISMSGQTATSPISFNQPITLTLDPISHYPITYTQTWSIDIKAAKAVRFTYNTDMMLGAHQLAIYEIKADGTPNLLMTTTGYTSGTLCTTAQTGQAQVKLIGYTGGNVNFNVQFAADNPLTTLSDLIVGGNGLINGSVGIGTTTPNAKLDVLISTLNNGNDVIANFKKNTPYAGSAIVRIGYNTTTDLELNGGQSGGWRYGSSCDFNIVNNSGNVNLVTGSAVRMSINRSGYVGIGTITPSTKAQVSGTFTVDASGQSLNAYTEGIRLGAASNGYSIIAFAANPAVASGTQTNQWWVGKDGRDNGFNIWGNSPGDTFHILPSGNVGIGTITPAYKLDVKGTIRAQEVLVNLDGADFVFEKEYKLLPIEHLATFVQKNKHLPDIPSADEMVKNGVSIGEMQNKLLQKVEELTLYVIQQQKKIEVLEQKLK